MKKTNIFAKMMAIITALVAIITGIIMCIETGFVVNKDYQFYGLFFALVMVMTIVFVVLKKKNAILITLLLFATTGIYCVKKMFDGLELSRTIIDVVSPSDNYNVLTVLLFVGFVACAILYLCKNIKYAKYYLVGYLLMLLLTTARVLPEVEMINSNNIRYLVGIAIVLVAGYSSFICYLFVDKKEENKQENQE